MQSQSIAAPPLSASDLPQQVLRSNSAMPHGNQTLSGGDQCFPALNMFGNGETPGPTVPDVTAAPSQYPLLASVHQGLSTPAQSPALWNAVAPFPVGSPISLPSHSPPIPQGTAANEHARNELEHGASPMQQRRYTYAGMGMTPTSSQSGTPRSVSSASSSQKRLNWAEMICYTISESPSGRLVIQDLFEGMCVKFPEVREWALGKDWEARVKNRIKSTLSIKSNLFVKVPRPSSASGKGSWWTLSAEAQEAFRQGRIAEAVRGTPNSSSMTPTLSSYSSSNGNRPYPYPHRHVTNMNILESPLQSPAASPFAVNLGSPAVDIGTPKIGPVMPGYTVNVDSPITTKSAGQVPLPQRMPSYDMYPTRPTSLQLHDCVSLDNPLVSPPLPNVSKFPVGFGNTPYFHPMHLCDPTKNDARRPYFGGVGDGNTFYPFGALSDTKPSMPTAAIAASPVQSESTQTQRQSSNQAYPHATTQPQTQQWQQVQHPNSSQQSQLPIAQPSNSHNQVHAETLAQAQSLQAVTFGQDNNESNALNDRLLFPFVPPAPVNGFDPLQYNPFGISTVGPTNVDTSSTSSIGKGIAPGIPFDLRNANTSDFGANMGGVNTHNQTQFTQLNVGTLQDYGLPFRNDVTGSTALPKSDPSSDSRT